MVNENKKNVTISSGNPVLTKRFDAEAYRGTANYTMNSYRNLGVLNTPGNPLRAYYCNSSYNPTGSTRVINSPFCALINSITPANILNRVYTDRNSTYSRGTYAITNGKFGGIVATSEFYIEYETAQGGGGTRYNIRVANQSTNTDVKFNDTKVAWTSTNSGTTWTQAAWTPDVFTTAVRATNDEFMFGLYLKDIYGNEFKNFTMIQDDITPTNHPISNPDILVYNSSAYLNDMDLNETHGLIMNIRIGCSKDPDSVGNVTHNLTLRNTDGTFNYTINASFKCPLDAPTWVSFNTSLVPPGKYRMNITATSGDNPLDIKQLLTENNFTIDIPHIDYGVVLPLGFIRFLNCSPDFENSRSLPEGQSVSLNSINATNNVSVPGDLQIRINQTAATGWKLYASNQSDLSQNITLSTSWQTIYSSVSDQVYRKIWLYANCSFISSNSRTAIELKAV